MFVRLATYHRTMNRRAYALCETISDDARKQDRGAFFGSIHKTLLHILQADCFWMRNLAGWEVDTPDSDGPLAESFEALRATHEAMDDHIRAWVGERDDAWFEAELTWRSRFEDFNRVDPHWLLLTHLFNHQTHHRGQLTTLLTQAGYDIGVTDLARLSTEGS